MIVSKCLYYCIEEHISKTQPGICFERYVPEKISLSFESFIKAFHWFTCGLSELVPHAVTYDEEA